METPPVLLLLFNRPDLAARVFRRVREAKPKRLFIAVDGPREGRGGEEELVQQNRSFRDQVDWPCEVETRFQESNLGCGRAVSTAIRWFFDRVDEGIILEDDCLPNPCFFPFQAELLARFRHDTEMMMVNGSNFQDGMRRGPGSYYFSRCSYIWGWGSWSRAWEHYDFRMEAWEPGSESARRVLEPFSPLGRWFMGRTFSRIARGEVDTWDYQWEFAILLNRGKTVTPNVNLVENIGFDQRATHTRDGGNRLANRPVGEISFPLRHPEGIAVDEAADRYFETQYVISPRILLEKARERFGRITSGR